MLWIIGSSLSALFLLWFDYRGNSRLSGCFKALASLSMVGYAITAYLEIQSHYALLILLGIALGALGDVFLISKNKKYFLLGMLSFLIGHLFYMIAFNHLEYDLIEFLITFGVMIFAGYHVFRWLRPSLSGSLVPGVAIYIFVLLSMTAMALTVKIDNNYTLVGLGAVLFMISDIFVAMHRFKTPHFYDRIIGIPLYYVGQYLLATSIVTLQPDWAWLPH